jgi:hypothetical protein
MYIYMYIYIYIYMYTYMCPYTIVYPLAYEIFLSALAYDKFPKNAYVCMNYMYIHEYL